MRALKNGNLLGIHGNRNRWQIDPDELDRWVTDRAVSDRPVTSHTDPVSLRAVGLEVENAHLRERLDDLRADRDAWRAQAEKLAELSETRARPGVLARIFGGWSR